MGYHRPKGILAWLKSVFSARKTPPAEIAQAQRLLVAIDRGGVPLNPAKVNAIARNLGLEVARTAPVEQTIQRIREAVLRSTHNNR